MEKAYQDLLARRTLDVVDYHHGNRVDLIGVRTYSSFLHVLSSIQYFFAALLEPVYLDKIALGLVRVNAER